MLPLVNPASIPTFTQPSLVNTAIPETNAQRVPFDNVAPPPSPPRAEPDVKRSPDFFAPTLGAKKLTADAAAEPSIVGRRLSGAPFGTPATIIAQLISQPVPQQTGGQLRTILAQYEKLITNSQTKYLPSNAGKPDAEPVGLFSQLLNQAGKPTKAQPARPSTSATTNDSTESDEISIEVAVESIAPAIVTSRYQNSLTRNELFLEN